MEKRTLAIAFFVLLGTVGAFLLGTRVGSSLHRHGHTVTAAHEQLPPPTPVAQK